MDRFQQCLAVNKKLGFGLLLRWMANLVTPVQEYLCLFDTNTTPTKIKGPDDAQHFFRQERSKLVLTY